MDRETGTVSLWTSKNGEPRTFPLRGADGDLTDVGALIERRWKARTFKAKDGPAVSAFVFHVAGLPGVRFRACDEKRAARKCRPV